MTTNELIKLAMKAGESTVEERRAALKVGDIITDPALLCEGMRVRVLAHEAMCLPQREADDFRCSRRAGEGLPPAWADSDSWWLNDCHVSDHGVTFLGYADKPATIEERTSRRVKQGDHVVRDDSTHEWRVEFTLGSDFAMTDLFTDKKEAWSTAHMDKASICDKPAPEVKGEATSLAPYMDPAARSKIADDLLRVHEEMRENAYAQAGIPQQSSAYDWFGATNGQQFSQPGYGETFYWGYMNKPEPTPPAKALPFRYRADCTQVHNAATMCLECESLIAELTDCHDREQGEHRCVTTKPVTRERYEPQCGAFVGRVLTPVRR
jgi:hypothetical protein